MRVSGIDKDGDWTFGKGKANYKRGSRAIAQNVITRLRSFERDWFLDVDAGVPWLELLGARGTERRILRAVERTVLQTEGVRAIERLRILSRNRRDVKIELRYVDVFDTTTADTLELTA